MATRSGGGKPPAKKKKPPASFQDNLEKQGGSRPEGAQPARTASRKRRLFSGWAMILALLLMTLAVVIWGLRQSASLQESMDIRFPAGTLSPVESPPAETMKKKAAPAGIPTKPLAVEAPAGDTLHRDETERRMAALEAGLASLENRPSPTSGKTTPDPAMVRALESVESTLAALMDHMIDLESRLQQAEISHEAGWALVVAGAELRAVLRTARPFAAELAALRETLAALPGGRDAGGDSLDVALAALEPYAEDGIPTLESLGRELSGLAPRLVATTGREETSLEEKDWITDLRGRLGSLITVRRTGSGVVGSSAEAVTARAEAALAAGDLKTAVAEMESLQGESVHMAASWLAGARARLAAEQSLAGISRRVTAILARDEIRQAPGAKKGPAG
ncbi:MAG: hypothetical protein ISR48_12015 [Alphaproteobacteria bacterium]|nr:hypothetical protein [Alphaproteobacteria bacterium]